MLSKTAGLEEWKLLFNRLDVIYERLYTLKAIYKEHLEKMIGPELKLEVNEVIQQISETLQNFAKTMEGIPVADINPLLGKSEQLSQALIEFQRKKNYTAI